MNKINEGEYTSVLTSQPGLREEEEIALGARKRGSRRKREGDSPTESGGGGSPVKDQTHVDLAPGA